MTFPGEGEPDIIDHWVAAAREPRSTAARIDSAPRPAADRAAGERRPGSVRPGRYPAGFAAVSAGRAARFIALMTPRQGGGARSTR